MVLDVPARQGGYDSGYAAAECFWGSDPGSLVALLERRVDLAGLHVLDLGTGEGKNASWLALRGCDVTAIDVSKIAIEKAKRLFDHPRVAWRRMDALEYQPDSQFDIVLAYGLLHCLDTESEARSLVDRMKDWTAPGGWNIVVSFNARHQDLADAHPGFMPLLLPHAWFMDRYADWDLQAVTDSDLHESHPDRNIQHSHSMTRILARRSPK